MCCPNKENLGYNSKIVDCNCGSEQTEQHMLIYPLNSVFCTPENLANATDTTIQIAN